MYILSVRYHSKNIHETFTFLPPLYVFIQSLMIGLSGKNIYLIGNNIMFHNKWKVFVVVCINRF